MQILHVIPTVDSRDGGSPIACISLCRELTRIGHDVTIFSTFARGERDNWQEYTGDLGAATIRCFPVRSYSYGLSASLFKELGPAVKAADIVHIHGVYRFSLVAASWWCRRYHVPYVVKPHGSLDPYVFRVRRWRKWPAETLLIAPIVNAAAAVHFTAEEEMHLAAQTGWFRAGDNLPIHNAVVVPEGIELPDGDDRIVPADVFGDLFPATRGKRVVLFLSRITFKKGLDILAKAFAIVTRKLPDTHLVIAGPDNEGYGGQVRGMLEREGVIQNVTFTGMLTGTIISAAYKAAAVFVLPSYTENFGLVVCEALSHTVPTVISNRVNIWREVMEARAGIITECCPSQVAKAIFTVLSDPTRAREMAERGRVLVIERFSARGMAGRMAAIYRSIVDRGANHTLRPVEAPVYDPGRSGAFE